MSRLIVRNLPKNIKEERIRSVFEAKGELTDVKLCYTKDGKFRRFGFIGYKTEEEAKSALNHFNKSFIDTSKIFVDVAKNLGDETLPRPWSKYSQGSSANERLKKNLEEKNEKLITQNSEGIKIENCESDGLGKKKDKKKKKRAKILGDLEDDVEFQEFLNVHKNRGSKQTWSNDNIERGEPESSLNQICEGREEISVQNKHSEEQLKYDYSDGSENEDEVYDVAGSKGVTEEENYSKHNEEDDEEAKMAKDSKLSDMDYLKSKVVSNTQNPLKTEKGKKSQKRKRVDGKDEEKRNKENFGEESLDTRRSENEEDSNDGDDDKDNNDGGDDDDDGSGGSDTNNNDKDSSDAAGNLEKIKTTSPIDAVFGTIKMKGLPFKAKKKHIRDFFAPLKVLDIRIIKNHQGKPTGCGFVDFSNEKDIKEALKRDRDFIQGRYIELSRVKEEQQLNQETEKNKPWMKKLAAQGEEGEFESIAESGRLFLRNLAFSCLEEDLQNLFDKFGPLTETYLPLDKTTNKPIGIGFVTFVMPEHAVKAFNELDGKVFQGRLLHILPSKAKETKEDEKTDAATSFKLKRDAKKKTLSGHDHNWNTLFLGMNAVADVMADQYHTTKGSILDDASSRSLAVRMALGETQVVTETRKFLMSQGVKLDVFGQPAAKRSKTVMLVKNLPFNTSSEELMNIFSPFGKVARLVLPPSGITALVEFFEPSLAKKAFQKLAYSKFKHVPLYLEWAPLGVFSEKPEEKKEEEMKTEQKMTIDEQGKEAAEDKGTDVDGEDVDDSENAEGTTVFVKNLNFETSEETLKEAFSKIGPLLTATIAKKKDPKKPGNLLSMGYGFVEYKKRSDALRAITELQKSLLEGHTLELKMSHRKPSEKVAQRKSASTKKQTSSKILVRNVPFEASKKEIKELFSTFGEIKTLRLPQKQAGTGSHRGFAFVDFLTKQDAKRAFESLCSSTHLYGRRLVLEWAEDEDSVDALRKRTAEHFHGTPKTAKKKKDILDDLLDSEMHE